MNSDKKADSSSASDWTTAATALLDKLKAKRAKKLNLRETNRQLKDKNYSHLAECIPSGEFDDLLLSPNKPASEEEQPLVVELSQIHTDVQSLRDRLEGQPLSELPEVKARELIAECIKQRVEFSHQILIPELAVLIRSVEDAAESAPNSKSGSGKKSAQPIPPISVSLRDLQSILAGKKLKKKIEDDRIKGIVDAKKEIEEILELVQSESSKSYFELSEKTLNKITEALNLHRIKLEDLEIIELKLQLLQKVKALYRHITEKIQHMDEEPTNLSEGLLHSIQKALLLDKSSIDQGLINSMTSQVQELVKKLRLKDDSLKEALDKLPGLVWCQNALSLLASSLADSSEIEEHINKVPKGLSSHELYGRLSRKAEECSKAPHAELSEKEVHKMLYDYMDRGSDLLQHKEELRRFIDKTRLRHPPEKIERLLSVANKLLMIYEKGDFSDCESVIEDLFELKFYGTKIFNEIEELQKKIERVQRELTHMVSPQVKPSLKSADKSTKNKNALTLMRELERPDISKVIDLLAQIAELPAGLRDSYEEDVKNLKNKIDTVEKFKTKMKDLRTKYQKIKQLPSKTDTMVSEFEKLIKEYCSLEFGCEDYRKEIEKYSWMVKANCALEGKTYDGSGKNIEAWKKIIENIRDLGGPLVTAMEKKVQTAKMFLKEVEKIKAAMSNPKGDKDKLPTLKEADELLKEVNKNCKEIDLGSEKNILDNIVAGVQSKLKLLQPDNLIMLHDLVNCMDFLKRAALNLKEEISPLIEIEKKASEFLQKVRELSPEQFIQKQFEFQSIYESLGVKVLEWEDMINMVNHEEKIIEKISSNIKSGMSDLPSIQDIREQYKNIKYLKDIRIETKLMTMYLQHLRMEFEHRQDLLIREENIKPAIDYVLLGALIMELDDLTYRMKTSETSLKVELMGLNDNMKFIHDLYNDVKRHLEYNVYSLNLDALNNQNIKKLYKKFIDITGPILDYKINLEFQEREKNQVAKTQYNPIRETSRRQTLVLESKYPRVDDPSLGSSLGHSLGHYGLGSSFSQAFDDRKSGTYLKNSVMAQPQLTTGISDQTNPGASNTGNTSKPNHHPFRDEPETIPVKPNVSNISITEDLRNYYRKNWKKLMESNPHLEISGLDALMASKSLEKSIYGKIKKNPLEYDVFCTSISNALRHIIQFKNISMHLRNEAFKPTVLLIYCDKPLAQLRKMEGTLKNTEGNTTGNTGSNVNQLYTYRDPTGLKKKTYPRDPPPAAPVQVVSTVQPSDSPQQAADNPIQNNPLSTPPNNDDVQYKNYNIFTGSFQVELGEKNVKAFDEVTLMTCSGYERIVQFTEIPKKVLLSTRIGKAHFVEYISKILQKSSDYKFLTGWVTYKKGHTPISSYLMKNDCVASQQYSENCKIFVFMVNFLSPEWLTKIPIYTSSATIEMMFFLVHKKKSETIEVPIVPKSVPLSTATAYRFIATTKIGLKPTSLDRIRETAKPVVLGTFGERFNDGEGEDDSQPKGIDKSAKQNNKLQFLIDQAGHIKKVPSFLIEEEARMERSRPIDTNYEEESIEEEDEPTYQSKPYKSTFNPPFSSLSKQALLEDRTNNFGSFSAIAGIDKEEFVRNAVNQITLPAHALFGAGLGRISHKPPAQPRSTQNPKTFAPGSTGPGAYFF